MAPDKALQILKDASEALSHASYCGITGTSVDHGFIVRTWDPLRELIKSIEPDNSYLDPTDAEFKTPTTQIIDRQ
jgi:hypothetical protein